MVQVKEKKCLVILGMHRSGTSAVAGTLKLAGFNPGKQLFDPEEDNPRGNYENARITMLNERILDELYACWNDTLLIPEDWWKFDKFNEYLGEIISILTDELNYKQPVLLKDPRLSCLLPLYLEAFKQLQITAKFIICIRNPLEIVESLKKRNHLSKEKIILLYMDYLLKAELYSRKYPRIILSYQNFLSNPLRSLKIIKELLVPEIQLNPESENKILSFLDEGLKHHKLPDQIPEIRTAPEVIDLFNILSSADLRDLPGLEMNRIDQLRGHFYEYFHAYNGLPAVFEARLMAIKADGSKISFNTPVKYGHNLLNFRIDPAIPVNKLHFMPSNSRVGLKIHEAEFSGEGDNTIGLHEMTTNASHENGEGILIFDTEMPEIIFNLPTPLNVGLVMIKIDYLAFGRTTYRMGLNFTSEFYEELESKLKSIEDQKFLIDNKVCSLETHIQNKEKELAIFRKLAADNNRKISALQRMNTGISLEIKTIKKSITWKSGRILTYPFRLIYDHLMQSGK